MTDLTSTYPTRRQNFRGNKAFTKRISLELLKKIKALSNTNKRILLTLLMVLKVKMSSQENSSNRRKRKENL